MRRRAADRLQPRIARLTRPDRDPAPEEPLAPKGALSPLELFLLLLLAALPLVSIALRSLAQPGSPASFGLEGIGSALESAFSLTDVPAAQRNHVLYLLFVPTFALTVAFMNLTLGIRLLGFRSLLIAVAFHESGIVASLLLIGVAVIAVLGLRPWLRAIRLPYYARTSVVVSLVATTMVAALLVGPWLHSDVVWGMIYFPVIVLGMLGEGIARAMDRGDPVKAYWLAANTVGLAFVMALVGYAPPLRDFLLRFPEIVLTEIVAIIMVSEYLDLRIFQRHDPRAAREASLARVAVVRNRIETGTPGKRKRHALRSVQKIVDALRHGGYVVKVLEGDPSLLKELRRFFPPDPKTEERRGIVLNLAHGVEGDAASTQVPAMLEMSGVPYSGPSPLGQAIVVDQVATKVLFQQAGIPTPAFRVLSSSKDVARDQKFPAIARPRHEPGARAVIVHDRAQLRRVVKRIVRRWSREVVVEEVKAGRHVSVALLGNDPVECLPLVETDPKGMKICPAPVDDAIAARMREYAVAAFRTCGCRDYARVDVLVTPAGELEVLQLRTLGILAKGGAFARAGREAGLDFTRLVCRIVEVTRSRSLANHEAESTSWRRDSNPQPSHYK